jgi:uracil-DNA glycosylase family 4
MNYPQQLEQTAKQRMLGFQVEGFLSGQGPDDARLMLIGEAPGKTEIETHIPFSGRAGANLEKWLTLAGLKRSEIYITSAVRSRPYHVKTRKTKITYPNRTPNKKEIFAHAPLLDFEIATIQPELLLPMGNIGLQRLLGPKTTITAVHGQLLHQPILTVTSDGQSYQFSKRSYFIYPLFHPASIMYNPALEPQIEIDWQQLKRLLPGLNNNS